MVQKCLSKSLFLCVLVGVVCSGWTVSAQESVRLQAEWDGGAIAVTSLSGVAGAGAGSVVGGLTGGLVGVGLGGDGWEGLANMAFGIALGSVTGNVLGTATGVYLAGEGYGLRGSWGASLLGSSVGAGAALGAWYGLSTLGADNDATALGLGLIFPALGATVGYALSTDPGPVHGSTRPPKIRTALVHFDEEEGFVLSPPMVGTGVDEEGGLKVSVPLLGGSF